MTLAISTLGWIAIGTVLTLAGLFIAMVLGAAAAMGDRQLSQALHDHDELSPEDEISLALLEPPAERRR